MSETLQQLITRLNEACEDARDDHALEENNREEPLGEPEVEIAVWELEKLLAALQQPPAVAGGWKLVPVEPTEAMMRAWYESAHPPSGTPMGGFSRWATWEEAVTVRGVELVDSYKAAIAAAPSPPQSATDNSPSCGRGEGGEGDSDKERLAGMALALLKPEQIISPRDREILIRHQAAHLAELKDWYARKAALEGDMEVGAGFELVPPPPVSEAS